MLARWRRQSSALTESERVAHLEAALAEKERELAQLREEKARELADVWAHAHKLNDALQNLDRIFWAAAYHHDSLAVWDKDVSFLREPQFVQAYFSGMNSGHKIGRETGSNEDIHIEWRVYVVCWAANHARRLDGDFVECGVNTGIYSLAACRYIDFNTTGKDFFLFDTFRGIPEEQMSEDERDAQLEHNGERYEECFERARQNFAEFPRVHLVRGIVPDSLSTVLVERVCYLSIDMNIVVPEIAAIEHFWDKLVPGAVVVLDDYGWSEHRLQREAMDRFASSRNVQILPLPTGQGLILKP